MKGALAFLALGAAAGAATLDVSAPKAMLEVYVSTSANTPGARMLRLQIAGGGVEEISFEGSPFLTGDSVRSADAIVAPGGGGEIRISLEADAARRLADVTSRNVGKRVGIVADGRLVGAPVVLAPLRDGTFVVAGLSLAEAQALAPRLGPSGASVRAATSGPPDSEVVSALEGIWIVKGATLNGEVVSDKKFLEGRWSFHAGGLELTNGVGERGRFTVATDPAAPSAFRVDPVPPSAEKPIWMLFRRDGNRLTVAFFDGLSKKPSDFDPERKKVVVELELSRRTP